MTTTMEITLDQLTEVVSDNALFRAVRLHLLSKFRSNDSSDAKSSYFLKVRHFIGIYLEASFKQHTSAVLHECLSIARMLLGSHFEELLKSYLFENAWADIVKDWLSHRSWEHKGIAVTSFRLIDLVTNDVSIDYYRKLFLRIIIAWEKTHQEMVYKVSPDFFIKLYLEFLPHSQSERSREQCLETGRCLFGDNFAFQLDNTLEVNGGL